MGVGLLDQGASEAEEPGAFRGGLASGVGDEAGDVAAPLGGRDPGGGVPGADRLIELHGQGGLGCGERGLGVLEGAQVVDQLGLVEEAGVDGGGEECEGLLRGPCCRCGDGVRGHVS